MRTWYNSSHREETLLVYNKNCCKITQNHQDEQENEIISIRISNIWWFCWGSLKLRAHWCINSVTHKFSWSRFEMPIEAVITQPLWIMNSIKRPYPIKILVQGWSFQCYNHWLVLIAIFSYLRYPGYTVNLILIKSFLITR